MPRISTCTTGCARDGPDRAAGPAPAGLSLARRRRSQRFTATMAESAVAVLVTVYAPLFGFEAADNADAGRPPHHARASRSPTRAALGKLGDIIAGLQAEHVALTQPSAEDLRADPLGNRAHLGADRASGVAIRRGRDRRRDTRAARPSRTGLCRYRDVTAQQPDRWSPRRAATLGFRAYPPHLTGMEIYR